MRVWVLAIALLCACSRPHGVVLWHAYNGAERDALEQVIAGWNAEHPDEQVTVVAVPYDAFADKLSSAIPRGNGPDLLIYAQDRLGDWADAKSIEPIEFWVDEARADRFTPQSLEAMAYRNSLWGLPLGEKSLALYYNPALVAEPPKTTDAILRLATELHPKGIFALAYPNVDLYTHAMWLHGYGGRVMDASGELTIATPEAANAMRFARQLVTTGATPEDAQNSLIGSLFNEGRAATVISGPWFVPDIDKSIHWKVTTLPTVSATGQPARPFRSTEGVMMSAHAHDKTAAFAVMDYLASDASAVTRATVAMQIVPNVHAWDDPKLANDATLATFREQLKQTVATPTDPHMRAVWTPYRTALGEVITGRADPATQLQKTQAEIQGYTHP